MKSRSLVFDLYGDYVRYHDGWIGVQSLARLADPFGVSEETARVTLSRMRREGWLDSKRVGRLSWYGLTDRGWRLLDTGRDRIFNRRHLGWDGDWQLVIYQVPESERAVRERLRNTLDWLGFGALAPSTWVSAHDRSADLQQAMCDRGIDARLDSFTSRTGSIDTDRALAARCWDLDGLHKGYLDFVNSYEPRLDDYTGYQDQVCFVERVRLVNAYRKFPFVDPDLPEELLPHDWAGTQAHAVFLQAYEALRNPAFRHFESVFDHPPS